jgi:hypothetical protein
MVEILGAYGDLVAKASIVIAEEKGVPKDKHTYKYRGRGAAGAEVSMGGTDVETAYEIAAY